MRTGDEVCWPSRSREEVLLEEFPPSVMIFSRMALSPANRR